MPLIQWKKISKFGVVGVICTLVDMGVFNVLLLVFSSHFPLRSALLSASSYFVGIICSYTLNRYWTFKMRDDKQYMFAQFVLVNLGGMGIHALMVWLFAWIGGDGILVANLGKCAAIGFAAVWSYNAYARWVFAQPRKNA